MSRDDGLPKGWTMDRLDAVAFVNPKKLIPNAQPDERFNFVPMSVVTEEFGGIDVSALRPFSEVQNGYTQFQSGDIISAKITPCMENGKIAVVPELDNVCAYGSTEFHVLRPRPGISSKWIAYYLLQSRVRRDAKRNMTGSAGQLRVPKPWIEGIVIPVAPSPEQLRIVATIEQLFSDLDAGVAALKRAKTNLKRYRAAVLKAAVEGKLTAAWRAKHPPKEPASKLLERILTERRTKWEQDQLAAYEAKGKQPPTNWRDKYKEPAGPDTAGLPGLPEGWCWVTVEQITTLVTKGSSPNWQGFSYVDDGVVFVRSQNVRWGALDLSDVAYLPVAFNDAHRNSVIRAGDVLLNLVGASIGRCSLATSEIDGGNLNQAVGIIRLVSPGFLNSLMIYFVLSPHIQEYIAKTKADVARANFNLDDVRPTPIPVPPVEEQRVIVEEIEERLSVVDDCESQLEVSTHRAARLRQSILKRAFEGKLVPQDPTDEPASILLERIRQERDEHGDHHQRQKQTRAGTRSKSQKTLF
ncbi:MAG: hypothetical protein FJ276_04665 [Planctomycetes bacterium]|nr:hypothetical protein [Planctomycetota bacterium]